MEQRTLQTMDNPFATSVTDVLGTLCHPCLRVGHCEGWCAEGIQRPNVID